MERISAITPIVTKLTTSESQPKPGTSTQIISPEQHAALFAIINKVRMLNGWTTKTAQELDATIRTWGEILNRYSIPIEHYPTLYWRAFDTRQGRLNLGHDVPAFDATLLVSHWTGPNGLQRELAANAEQERIRSGRYLDAGRPDDLDPKEGFAYFKSLLNEKPSNAGN